MTAAFINIKTLVNCRDESYLLRGPELARLPSINEAYLIVENDQISGFGSMADLPVSLPTAVIDLSGKIVLPAWCDSHTHIVFAGSRENEFIDKIQGLSYAEIAAKGGGILNSANLLNNTSEQELFVSASSRLKEMMRLGTGAVEIKSGYGLTVEGELKMLRVIRRLQKEHNLIIKSTFLGAHTYPVAYKNDHEGYIRLIIDEMLPAIANGQLADYIDVFCENGFFSPEETERICRAGMAVGLKPKIHANQLNLSGGIETGIKLNALSVDHLETINDDLINQLAASPAIATLLPGAAFFLGMRVTETRKMIEAGCALALASDYNPGSCPSGNMNLVLALACIQLRMLPEEAINAATLNGAFAMECAGEAGSITKGKKANFIVTRKIPSLNYLPYAFGTNLIDAVYINGQPV